MAHESNAARVPGFSGTAQQFADAQPSTAEDLQSDRGEQVGQIGDCGHQCGVHRRGQGPGQWAAQFRDVGGEHQLAGGGLGPAPGGDVLEHVAQGQDRGLGDAVADRDRSGLAAPPVPVPVEGQELHDVVPAQLPQAGDLPVVGSQELAERQQVVDQTLDRVRSQHGCPGLHVAHQHGADLGGLATSSNRCSIVRDHGRRRGGWSVIRSSNRIRRRLAGRAR